ncbi:MAG: FeoB small GTPase domain-containing protein, partial [Syntrophomonadaceae bacterium]|nr:FeoB small GTPase domain-containing protein [Syntrophomonadaceae bacterium]
MKVALLGQPNVGKSSVLTRLTGARVFVSNYPGTSVELVSGTLVVAGHRFEVLDTPGIYSLGLAEAEETVSRKTALAPDVGLILNVVDASNLGRNLALTLELLELGKPVVVLLNQIDRARALGIDINHRELSRLLGCPVFPFSAVTGEGVVELTEYLHGGLTRGFHPPRPAAEVVPLFTGPGGGEGCRGDCRRCLREEELVHCPQEEVWARHERAHAIAMRVTRLQGEVRQGWLARLEAVVDNPWAGTPLLLGLLYAAFRGLVAFVGWAEEIVAGIFGPVQEGLAQGIGRLLPPGFWRDVLSSGVPEGLLVPFALVLPAMLMVAVLMALLEDSGLLPRYAVALERLAGLFGVSGQAFIPLALGFGCRTPAVVATRMLPTPQQRFIVIALLSIVIPCAATVGMITAVVAALQASLGVVAASMLVVFILLGLVLSRLFGDRTELLYELPPLRVPTL